MYVLLSDFPNIKNWNLFHSQLIFELLMQKFLILVPMEASSRSAAASDSAMHMIRLSRDYRTNWHLLKFIRKNGRLRTIKTTET